jgi:hypothetical protein
MFGGCAKPRVRLLAGQMIGPACPPFWGVAWPQRNDAPTDAYFKRIKPSARGPI